MKRLSLILAALISCIFVAPASAQIGGAPDGGGLVQSWPVVVGDGPTFIVIAETGAIGLGMSETIDGLNVCRITTLAGDALADEVVISGHSNQDACEAWAMVDAADSPIRTCWREAREACEGALGLCWVVVGKGSKDAGADEICMWACKWDGDPCSPAPNPWAPVTEFETH